MRNSAQSLFILLLFVGKVSFAETLTSLEYCKGREAELRQYQSIDVDHDTAIKTAREFASFPFSSTSARLNFRVRRNTVFFATAKKVNRIFFLSDHLKGEFHFAEYRGVGPIPKPIYDEALSNNVVLLAKQDGLGIKSDAFHDVLVHASGYYILSRMNVWPEVVQTMKLATLMMKDQNLSKFKQKIAGQYRGEFADFLEEVTTDISVLDRTLEGEELEKALEIKRLEIRAKLDVFANEVRTIRDNPHFPW